MTCKKDIIKRLGRIKSDEEFRNTIRKCKCEDIEKITKMFVLAMSKRVPVSRHMVKFLQKNRKCIRHLVHPQYSWKSKRRYLMQRGGTKGSILKAGGKLFGKAVDSVTGAASTLARSPVMTRALAKELAAATPRIPLKSMQGMSKSTSSLSSASRQATTSLTTKIANVVPTPTSTAALARKSMRLPLVPGAQSPYRVGKAVAGGIRHPGRLLTRSRRAMRKNPRKTIAAGTVLGTGVGIGFVEGMRAWDRALTRSAAATRSATSKARGMFTPRATYEYIPQYSLFRGHTSPSVKSPLGKRTYDKTTRNEVYKLHDMATAKPPRAKRFATVAEAESSFTTPHTKRVTATEAETSFGGSKIQQAPSAQTIYHSAHSSQASFDVPSGAGKFEMRTGIPKESMIYYSQKPPANLYAGYKVGEMPKLSVYDSLATPQKQLSTSALKTPPELHKFDSSTSFGSTQSLNAKSPAVFGSSKDDSAAFRQLEAYFTDTKTPVRSQFQQMNPPVAQSSAFRGGDADFGLGRVKRGTFENLPATMMNMGAPKKVPYKQMSTVESGSSRGGDYTASTMLSDQSTYTRDATKRLANVKAVDPPLYKPKSPTPTSHMAARNKEQRELERLHDIANAKTTQPRELNRVTDAMVQQRLAAEMATPPKILDPKLTRQQTYTLLPKDQAGKGHLLQNREAADYSGSTLDTSTSTAGYGYNPKTGELRAAGGTQYQATGPRRYGGDVLDSSGSSAGYSYGAGQLRAGDGRGLYQQMQQSHASLGYHPSDVSSMPAGARYLNRSHVTSAPGDMTRGQSAYETIDAGGRRGSFSDVSITPADTHVLSNPGSLKDIPLQMSRLQQDQAKALRRSFAEEALRRHPLHPHNIKKPFMTRQAIDDAVKGIGRKAAMVVLGGTAVGGLVAAGTMGGLYANEKQHNEELKKLIQQTTKQYVPPPVFFPTPEKRANIPTPSNTHYAGSATTAEPKRKEIDYWAGSRNKQSAYDIENRFSTASDDDW